LAIEKMRLLRLAGAKENIEEFLLTAFSTNDLHAELAARVVNEGNGGTLLPEDNTYADYLNRIENITNNLRSNVVCAFDGVSVFTQEEIEREIEVLEKNFEKITETKLSQSNLTKEDRKAINILREFDINSLNRTHYVEAVFGRLPISSLPKIDMHDVVGFNVNILMESNSYVWILAVGLSETRHQVDNLLESLFFEPINIPKVDEKELEFYCESIIGKIYGFVKYKADIRKYYKYIAVFGETCVISGFVPLSSVKQYKTLFGQMHNVVIEDLPAQKILSNEDKEALQFMRKFDLGEFGKIRYSSIHFGKIPISSLPRLVLNEDMLYMAQVLMKNNEFAWILYITLADEEYEAEAIFEALHFIAIPITNLEATTTDEFDNEIESKPNESGTVIRIKKIKSKTGEVQDFVVQDFPASLEEGLEPPTVLRNNWFAKPFELFIDMYGLPHYNEFDPTFFVAVTYCLLFGIMFGDLGQGLVLVLGGAYLWKKKKMVLAAVAMRIGFFSMFFGLIYGSFFGDEEILNGLYIDVLGLEGKLIDVMSPDATMVLLGAAVGLGAVLILMSIGINIVLNLKRKKVGEALFTQNGVAGFIFYGSAIVMVTMEMIFKIKVLNLITEIIFFGIPLVIILFRIPLKNLITKVQITPHEGWGGYILESVFELLEVILSFVSNTMSFLRVGGFVLSHAGMMVVVMTLRTMSGSGLAGFAVLVIGNIFVIGLEGLIVGIQTLRLQYYEMFSRYFEGGGKKYIPTTTLDH
jgi:V/A-type H+-transporting ATPase subunit I